MTGPIGDARIKAYIDERIDDLVFGGERLDLDARIDYLLRLVIQQRQAHIEARVFSRLQDFGLSNLATEVKQDAQSAGRALLSEGSWFKGAFREAADPAAVFDEWIRRTRNALDRWDLGSWISEDDELPPPPIPFQT